MAGSTLSSALSRLAARCCRRRPSPKLSTLNLSTEIILSILDHLDLLFNISLALTCRALYNICFPKHQSLSPAQNEKLMLWLEKDVAKLFYCHVCTKLHHWSPRWRSSSYYWLWENLPCTRSYGQHQQMINLQRQIHCCIPFHHARSMNRHLFGPAHGLPLRKFDDRKKALLRYGSISVTAAASARIVDDKLLFSNAVTIFHTRGDPDLLRLYVDEWGAGVCSHRRVAREHLDSDPPQLPEIKAGRGTVECFVVCNKSLGSCKACLTDYSIDISWRGPEKGFRIEIKSYIQLGDCRVPKNNDWSDAIEARLEEPGAVRDRWIRGDTTDEQRGITSYWHKARSVYLATFNTL